MNEYIPNEGSAKELKIINNSIPTLITDFEGNIIDYNHEFKTQVSILIPEQIFLFFNKDGQNWMKAELVELKQKKSHARIILPIQNHLGIFEKEIIVSKIGGVQNFVHWQFLNPLNVRSSVKSSYVFTPEIDKHLAKSINDVIWMMDIHTRQFLYISPGIERLRGISVEEAMNESLESALHPDDQAKIAGEMPQRVGHFYDNLPETSFFKDIVRQTHKEGYHIWVEIVSTFLLNTQDEIIGVIGVSRDVSERIEAKNKLQDANQKLEKLNNVKDKIFRIIAHDLKTPLASSTALLEILLENCKADKELKEMLAGLFQSHSALLYLVENLLTWARIQSDMIPWTPESIDFNELVDEANRLFQSSAESKQVKLFNQAEEGIKVEADKFMLETIMRNLLSNAVKFTREGGKVAVSIKPDGHHAVISVKDTGVGMPKETFENLFDDNYSSTYGTKGERGTGIGLMLCKEFLDRHNTKLVVESAPGAGSTFSFSLPLAKK